MRIFYKLILGFLVSIVLIFVMGYYSVYVGEGVLKRTVGGSHARLSEETLDKIDRVIHSKIEIFDEYARNLIVRDAVLESNLKFEEMEDIQAYIDEKDRDWVSAPKEEITPFMEELISADLSQMLKRKVSFYEREQLHAVYSEVFVTNRYGANIAQTAKTTDYRQDDEEWWQAAKRHGSFVSDIEYDQSADVYSVSAAIAIEDDSGNFIGAMKVVLNIDEAIRVIKEIEATSRYKTKNFRLITERGEIIYATEKAEILNKMPGKILEHMMNSEKSGYFTDKGGISGEEEYLYAYARSEGHEDYKGSNWILLIEHETKEIFEPLGVLKNEILITLLGVIALAAISSLFISFSISRPIEKLKAAANEIGKGNLDIRIDVKSRDEIGELAFSFNKMISDLKNNVTSIENFNKEIAVCKEVEIKLEHVAKEWHDTFNAISDLVFILDKEYNFVKVNRSFCNAIKAEPEDLIGKKCHEVLHKSGKLWPGCPAEATYEDGKPHTEEVDDHNIGLPLLISTSPLIDENGEVIGVVHIAKDITKRKKAEEDLKKAYTELKEVHAQLIQSEKMAALGQLATGAAHEINNPLTAISGEAEMLLKDKDTGKDTKNTAKIIIEQSKRIKGIIERLLEFSRKKEFKMEPLDINNIVEQSLTLLAFESKMSNIGIERKLDPNIPKIYGDSGQLQEVFLNIMLNAIQAMPEGGKLTIRTYGGEAAEYGRRKSDVFKPGQKIIVIEIKDTGRGMDEQTQAKVFDPFFTTKEKSTGLGLSVSYGIIQNHKGIIEVASKPGGGSTFFVKLPVEKSKKSYDGGMK